MKTKKRSKPKHLWIVIDCFGRTCSFRSKGDALSAADLWDRQTDSAKPHTIEKYVLAPRRAKP